MLAPVAMRPVEVGLTFIVATLMSINPVSLAVRDQHLFVAEVNVDTANCNIFTLFQMEQKEKIAVGLKRIVVAMFVYATMNAARLGKFAN